jgi:formylmethanofuran dehydrogenase subunit A
MLVIKQVNSRKFKVGDQIKVLNNEKMLYRAIVRHGQYTLKRYEDVVGKTGTVTNLVKDRYYWVEILGDKYPLYVFFETELS